MRLFPIITRYAVIALAWWLLDSLILSSSASVSFGVAFVAGVSSYRLILRLIVLIIIAIIAYNHCNKIVAEREAANWGVDDTEDVYYGSAESRDRSRRLVYYSLAMAKRYHLSKSEMDKLRTLCYCHDIGLFVVSDKIVRRKRSLGEFDQKLLDQHIEIGSQIVAAIKPFSIAANLVRCHEEKYNGRGYLGLSGKRIPLECRIFRVALMYDYLTVPFNQQRALVCNEALNELRYYEGNELDPEVVDVFRQIMGNRFVLRDIRERIFSIR